MIGNLFCKYLYSKDWLQNLKAAGRQRLWVWADVIQVTCSTLLSFGEREIDLILFLSLLTHPYESVLN